MSSLVRVLCVSDYYLPGYLGGGPIRTLANMRAALGSAVELAIFTRDRDLGASAPYPDIAVNEWLPTPDGPIRYAAPGEFGARGLARAARGQDFDLLYLNSYFGFHSSIAPRLWWRRAWPDKPVLLAPRGEFSPGALAIKAPKKSLFLTLMRRTGLDRNLWWHASTAAEAEDILRQFPAARGRVHLAVDPVHIAADANAAPHPEKTSGQLRIAFISRISPKKNLDGLLDMLKAMRQDIELSIYGPLEDRAHWQGCEARIAALPDNIRARYCGSLSPEQVSPTFAAHDLFAFPTHGENFGHVIFESLRAGTPVLLSDQTPWAPTPDGAITVVPLADVAGWRQQIARAADRNNAEQQAVRAAALAFARTHAANSGTIADNIRMFQAVASARKF